MIVVFYVVLAVIIVNAVRTETLTVNVIVIVTVILTQWTVTAQVLEVIVVKVLLFF